MTNPSDQSNDRYWLWRGSATMWHPEVLFQELDRPVEGLTGFIYVDCIRSNPEHSAQYSVGHEYVVNLGLLDRAVDHERFQAETKERRASLDQMSKDQFLLGEKAYKGTTTRGAFRRGVEMFKTGWPLESNPYENRGWVNMRTAWIHGFKFAEHTADK